MWFLGIDIGTTHVKAAGVTDDGTLLEPGRVRTPTGTVDGLACHDAEEVWRAAADLVARYARTTAAPYGRLAGVAVASFGQEESVPVDRHGNPLHPSLAWWETWPEPALDTATADLVSSFEHYRASGITHRPDQTPERTAHLRRAHPEVWRDTARWVDFCTFATHRMTGEWTAAASQITHSQCFDVATLAPDSRLMDRLGMDPGMFAPALHAGADAGAIRPDALPGVPLAPGARAVVGGHDQVVAARQAHAADGARVLDSIGTSEYLMVLADTCRPDRGAWELGVDWERSWTADGFVLGHPVPTGKVVQLLAELCYGGDFDALFAGLAAARPGALPGLSVRLHDASAAGAGLLTLDGLPAGARPGDVVRRCLDQLSDAVREAADRMCVLAGIRAESVALMGSLFRRPEMAGHRAGRWDVPLRVLPLAEPVAHGAALLARDALTAPPAPPRPPAARTTQETP
ncbi:FGGY family carbohydrate kinase [Streptomyces sp. NPDC047002]|uniref:FGGY family carbohydrate kinase n=1 Tax=Streptomyces sp. NPDC047002 TaxID=3155475 RepID=UPI0034534929